MSCAGVKYQLLAFCTVLALWTAPARALEPGEIVLVVNKNAVEGVKLAQYYAKLRGVPENQIVQLNLPGTDEISFDQYERDVVPPLRAFLRANALEQKVKCLLTFYGMPLRIGARPDSPELAKEKSQIEAEAARVRPEIEPIITSLEALAQNVNSSFHPGKGVTIDALAHRADEASGAVNAALPTLSDVQKRAAAYSQMVAVFQKLAGTVALADRIAPEQINNPKQTPAEIEKWTKVMDQVAKSKQLLAELKERRWDPQSRQTLRNLVRDNFGLLEYARLLQVQLEFTQNNETIAALDSELALLRWDYYARARWQVNYLRYEIPAWHGPPVLMVMRLDAPDAGTVRDMIIASIKVEKEGLKGRAVVDSRGMSAQSKDKTQAEYAPFDDRVRNLAHFIKDKTSLPLVWDDRPDIILKGARGEKIRDVAVYCGWYRVAQYEPAFAFKLGAVGYHIASFELTTLHGGTGGWVKNLISDGVVATLGAVAEPYLSAFPMPDEFFPLLFTGKLSLAEVYWKTCPMCSWMITMIGDPLYRPFKENPLVPVEDLSPALQKIFAVHPTSSTRPGGG